MSKGCHIPKTAGAVIIVLTLLAIAGIITLIVYKVEISKRSPIIRLPGNLIPESYKIYIQPHFYTRIIKKANATSTNQTMLFTGNSTVNVHCVQETKTIFLHSEHLTISGEKVVNRNTDEVIGVYHVTYHEGPSNFLEITLGDVLEEGGNYSLFLEFRGEMVGFPGLFVNTYTEAHPDDGDDGERFLASSQMEPTHARSVFPCFDEPAMKAVFDVTIIHRQGTIAIGNGGESDSGIIDDEWKYTQFYPTKKMSTYLLAFTVSEFTPTPSAHENVTINTFARPEATEAGHANYAASVTGKILTFFENYCGINYPMRKLDQFAVPNFFFGGMENWGCVIYTEPMLLFEEGVSSMWTKEMILKLIAHELAHQWFGNLVTMRWWNEIWLNEGFATFMAYVAIDHVEPSLNIKDTFVIQDLRSAFIEDSIPSSHPLSPPETDVQKPQEIIAMLDEITYLKGASVIRMLEDFVTPSVFHTGVKMYLNSFQYGNTDQNDLWKCIQKAVDDDGGHIKVAEVMETWTNQAGYPLVTINTTTGEISQRNYQYDDSSESSILWHIPIRLMSNTSGPSLIWLNTTSTIRTDMIVSTDGEWILANVNCTGFYKVNYDLDNWNRLMTQLEANPQSIPMVNRWQIIEDAFNFANAKRVNLTLALDSTRFLHKEMAHPPWETAMRKLQHIIFMFERSEVYGPIQMYLRKQIKGLYNFLSNYTDSATVPEDHSLQSNQILAVTVACTSELPECKAMATRMFAYWMTNKTNIIHPNLRSVIYCQAVAFGGQEEWDFAWDMFQNSTDLTEKERLFDALGCTQKIWLLSRYLTYTLIPDKLREADIDSVIAAVARNVVGQDLAWNFVREHWDRVSQFVGSMVINSVTIRFSTDVELEELERFLRDHHHEDSWAVDAAIERIRNNIQWVNENKEVILEWFQSQTAT